MLDKLFKGLRSVLYWFSVAAMSVMLAVIFAQVVSRYLFNWTPEWSEELARYLFVWVVFLGAPIGVKERGHMALRLVQERLSPGGKKFCTALVYAAAFLFLAVLTWQGVALVSRTVFQVSPTLQIHMRWVYVAIPIGSLLMLFHLVIIGMKQGIAEHPLYVPEG